MATMFYDKDADPGLILGRKVAVIGYGSQGHAHALNLKDSGVSVVVGLPATSRSIEKATAAGLQVMPVADAAKWADVIMVLIPDQHQAKVYAADIAPHLTAGKLLMFAHGFAIRFQWIVPPADVDVAMVAPKAPGHRMREQFKEGIGVPGLLAIHQDASGHAKEIGLAYAKGVGCTKSGVLETTFKNETETDLFGEQTVLCGGITALINTAFETLVEAGYPPEMAYFECLHEMKLIVDLIQQGGFNYMRYSVSDTAEYGDLTRGPRVIDQHVKENMKKILAEIQDGSFAREWITENHEGRPRFRPLREQARHSQIQEIGKDLRSMMPWLDPKEV